MSVSMDLLKETDEAGRALFRLREPYHCQLGPGCLITVPAGYVTNFGTVPRRLSWIVSPIELREPAIVHDYMCNEQLLPAGHAFPESGFSRWMADSVFYELMGRIRLSVPKRVLVWLAVRTWAWRKKIGHWAEPPEKVVTEERGNA